MAPVKVDLKAVEDKLTSLADEQNTGELVTLGANFVSTITANGAQKTEEQTKIQQTLTDKVYIDVKIDSVE